MTRHELEDRIRAIPWPGPPLEMRDRTLSEAALSPARIVWSDRIWFSRGWRLSAAAAAIALAGMSLWPGRIGFDRALAQVLPAANSDIESVIRDAGFPDDVARAMTRRSRAELHPAAAQELRAVLELIEGGD